MGEAWSDWYAMDLLVATGQENDTAADGEVRVGKALTAGGTIRTQPMDCAVGSTDPACPGTPGAGPGGYTYGDFGRVVGQPQVHSDGEIWSQTLWDLRTKIGVRLARSLVTRAMELSPANPSYLDMRNSILQADLVVNEGKKQKAIWKVFASRGMGFFAGAADGDDSAPVEDFSMPPPAGTPRGSLTGVVTDTDSGAPVTGATVAFGGHNSGFAGDLAAVTGPTGRYTITGVIPGTYPKVFARGAGYDPVTQTVSIASRPNTLNWSLRRDWAALGGGSAVVDFNGEDFTEAGCGPSSLFDQSQGLGWSTDAVFGAGGAMDPRFAVVRLPVAVNVAEISVNPSNNCGDGGSASTGDFRVETSPDGTTWTVASTGRFGIANRNRMNSVPLAAGSTAGVRFVRYTMLSTQLAEAGGTCPGPFSGCSFVDSVEVAVYGLPTP
jgi:extracellular elastinolytic metalloproteinase